MGRLYDMLMKDVRFAEGLNACINCGTCTAICPAAEFYNYDPRSIVDTVQSRDEEAIEALLKSNTIWYCGECMSCKTRCPRSNAPGLIIIALRSLSQDLGYFMESEKGRQQFAVKRTVGDWIINTGYCMYLKGVGTDLHPEHGPLWDWEQQNWDDIFERIGANFQGEGPGILRKIPQETLDELTRIFEVTGGMERFRKVEQLSAEKAKEMGMNDKEYFDYVNKYNSNTHSHHED